MRFSADDAAAFLKRVMGLRLAPDEIAALEARTEGWIAALRGRQDIGTPAITFPLKPAARA